MGGGFGSGLSLVWARMLFVFELAVAFEFGVARPRFGFATLVNIQVLKPGAT